jgi:hypothetical protein
MMSALKIWITFWKKGNGTYIPCMSADVGMVQTVAQEPYLLVGHNEEQLG